MSRCNTCWMDGGPTLATPGSPIRGSFDTDEGLLMGDSPLQDALFALGIGSAFDSTGLFIRDKLFTEGCELELRFEDDSNSDGATADRILMSPSDAYVEGGHCSGDSRISHVNSMSELPEEKNKYHMDRRLHSSCQSFIDIGLQQDDNDGILPGATDIVLLDTDEEYQHAPLEGFSGDSDSSNSTAAALDLKRIISVASFSVPTLDGSNAHFHAPLLSSRTVSPSVTHASDSIQNAFSMQPVAAMQTATGFFSSLKPAKCMAADAASGRPRRVTATAFDVADVVECPLKVGKKRGSGAQAGKLTANPNGHACTACGALTTPVWRAGPHGPKTLCNACGVRYMKVAKRK